ncbi:MAG: nitroreductase family protein [Cetobacterium sp.]|nr:nitroreductase family protein [Cetobacterium sp.]
MDFLSRRTIRKYRDVKIENFKVNEILRTALVSPSGKNTQPYEFIVVENKDILKELSTCKKMGAQMLENAPLAIVVLGNPKLTDTWIEDCSIVSTIIQLKSYELGLGSCWIQTYGRFTSEGISSEEYIRNLLNIPENLHVLNIVSIGYPAESKRSYSDEDMDFSKVNYDKYGKKDNK